MTPDPYSNHDPDPGPASDPRRAFTLDTVPNDLRAGLLALVSPAPDAGALCRHP